ncbi:lipoprotein signal peptidase [Candidatus Nitrotoga sp. HW29]|uniref:signal peptidase II n=1 Tax=Candidatus Nitrotoga sp. HW29 TaxID=2886963 RepID=UPI001EF3B7E6|nr:signal peptidase II [Candidatus Nitrotoga sp. HW29]CAH1904142.1 lipoprotein signal peptidase [Candidatus Nitrotoga sp. HW29]
MTKLGEEEAGLKHWLSLATVIVILDQITKLWISQIFVYGENMAVTNFFNLVLVHNSGAAFSFLSNAGGWQRWLFSAVAAIASVWIIWLLRKYKQEKLFCFALALILGGALGNLIDRAVYGYVVDFLDFYWSTYHFPAFNIADSAVTCGAGLLLWESFTKKA